MLEGHLLNERYQIKGIIGGGGMANVYSARDLILERDVAIKVLRLEYANDAEFIARFDREAQSATSLSHPNIVNIYDVGEEEHILYMVMEYIDGMTLKELLQKNGPVDFEAAVAIMKQVARAIGHAHANGLIHRDIKPQNILIDEFNQVKVTDFGIALALSATSLTQTNSIVGSVHYISPEQARGGAATKKSDIYALGIVLYELLTAKLPFNGQSPVAIALQHLQQDLPSVRSLHPHIPQSVENIVLKATAKDPLQRYDSVYEMDDALEAALDQKNQNEPKFMIPVEAGQETKAIPIISDEHFNKGELADTIIHKTNQEQTEEPIVKEKAKKQQKKKKSKKKKWLIISLILFLLLAAGGSALFIFPQLFKTKDVDVPNLEDMEYKKAIELLKERKLKGSRTNVVSNEIEADNVVRTDPGKGRTVKEESAVILYVSEGKEKIEFLDHTGGSFNKVEKELTSLGFKEVKAYEEHSQRPKGEILSQIQPESGEEVIPSETSVSFEVSSGPELVSLNNLKGMVLSEVQEYIDRNELSLEVSEEHSDTVPKGEVMSQSPDASTDLEKNSKVKVILSKGPEKKEPIKHEVTFTVPYKIEEDDDPEDRNDQEVEIYIGDMKHDINDVYKDKNITKDREFTITLTVDPEEPAEYKVFLEEDLIIEKTVEYEEVNE